MYVYKLVVLSVCSRPDVIVFACCSPMRPVGGSDAPQSTQPPLNTEAEEERRRAPPVDSAVQLVEDVFSVAALFSTRSADSAGLAGDQEGVVETRLLPHSLSFPSRRPRGEPDSRCR